MFVNRGQIGFAWREGCREETFLPEENTESCHLWETRVGAEQKGESNIRAPNISAEGPTQSTEDRQWLRERLGSHDGSGEKSEEEMR